MNEHRKYNCPRCCYKTNKLSSMKNHILKKKKMCKLVKNGLDVNPREYIDDILRIKNERIISNNNYTINNTINANITINMNGVNDTCTDFLTDKDYKYFISRIINSIPCMVKKIHFNPNHPENHNIYITNKRNNEIRCFNGEKWIIYNKDKMIDELIETNESKLSDWLESGKIEYEREMGKFEKYLELKNKDCVLNTLKKELKLLLFNDKDMIEDTIKKIKLLSE